MSIKAESAWAPRGWPAERASAAPGPDGRVEAYCYTDRFSYAPGERVDLHVHATAATYDVAVIRDGLQPERVWARSGLPGAAHPTPENAYAVGCGWPVALSIEIGADWHSGFYLVVIGAEQPDGERWEREHFFVVRSAAPGRDTPYALVVTTSTLLAYNDWGGANHYRGIGDDPREEISTPLSHLHRPISRGHLRKPAGAPREGNRDNPPIGFTPRYPAYEWARLHGYGRHHADAGWATYERPFVVWGEQHGYSFDLLTQHDLDERPDALDGYRCAVIVGHDEYWSWKMRDTLDAFVDGGGNVARFAGNYEWQVRLEEGGTRQACYRLPKLDPVAAETPHLATTLWEAKCVDRPGATTMGLNGSGGIYNRYGAATPRSSGGFTVYRHDHGAFEGADLFYGDVLGALPVGLAAFEVDSVEFTFHRGMPYPTYEDGAPENLEILALCPAVLGEVDRWGGSAPLGANMEEFTATIAGLGDDAPERLVDRVTGAGMIACFQRGGTVFNGGTTEWVVGLTMADPFTERITHNVLRRLGAHEDAGA
ncbi:N,N-dimethylformamidase beta subunit family domain-containing protein [Conexibacter stalactiti]|uniref:DUF6605 domain-containing protein n=1 Tax=Conexibacter stalactiti TaxID=1940611 RepID=A0ABU4HLG5_9ACTN|nr:N,N-dimethylformamidase beta subunit family domain-containing protein [Conexibacter stalactiti]MDW5593405.1 DUF6605 domain-containing protein [Conexibacter stalactiti]MEC5034046.1 N,N-dimethylformamidase beta subunit family domain-containing protein [Conexibacter stalactiti]